MFFRNVKAFIVILVTSFNVDAVLSATCIFTHHYGDSLYTCDIVRADIRSENDVIILGDHLPGLSDADVARVGAFGSRVNFLPGSILRQFPNSVFMSFNHVRLEGISKQSFDSCEWVLAIDFSNNLLRNIVAGAFENCQRLESLSLRRNEIAEINEDAFFGMENLENLELDNNRLSKIHQKMFLHLNGLKNLTLSNNNISTIQPRSFNDLKLLELLDLSKNELTVIVADVFNLPSLRELFLPANSIRRLNSEAFEELQKLEIFHIKNASVDEIQQNFFSNFPVLKRFNAEENICIDKNLTEINSIESSTALKECFENWQSPRTTTTSKASCLKNFYRFSSMVLAVSLIEWFLKF